MCRCNWGERGVILIGNFFTVALGSGSVYCVYCVLADIAMCDNEFIPSAARWSHLALDQGLKIDELGACHSVL